MVMSNRNKPFKITKLEYDSTLLQVTQEPIPKEPGYVLEINPKLENVPVGDRRQTVIVIETDAAPKDRYEVQVHIQNSKGSEGIKPNDASTDDEQDDEKPEPPPKAKQKLPPSKGKE
ncbi:MAG: hypothetical protein ACLGPL_03710, partial [Acidobacteriota bacterium]